jgi:hypothetical protein
MAEAEEIRQSVSATRAFPQHYQSDALECTVARAL